MVLGEVRRGIDKLGDRNPEKTQHLEDWLEAVLERFGGRVLTIDENDANTWGSMTVKRALPLVDGLLAATAKAHRITFVTRNTKDIDDLEVDHLNPFES